MDVNSLNDASAAARSAMRLLISRNWLFYFTQGVLLAVAGVIALIAAAVSTTYSISLLGWVVIATGFIAGIRLLKMVKVADFWVAVLVVAWSLLIGVLLLSYQNGGLLLLSLLILIFVVLSATAKLIVAAAIRPLANWLWVLASGVFGLALAGYLWSRAGVAPPWLLGVVVGLQLLFEGTALAFLARSAGRLPRNPEPAAKS